MRRIIHIDTEKCNGCGNCAAACHEGAIAMVDGKAKLIRDDYCDGLGDCLPLCPTQAITFIQREDAAYTTTAVQNTQRRKQSSPISGGCPGSKITKLQPHTSPPEEATPAATHSQLAQWPVQLKLVPVNAAYFKGAQLLIAADCSAYSYSNFHQRFMRNHITLIGCPKLDNTEYSEKLTAILRENEIRSLRIVCMEVPCCQGIVQAAKTALQASGKIIPWQIIVLSRDGKILSE